MGRDAYKQIGEEIMADGDFDTRIDRALEYAQKQIPADETEGTDGFYSARAEAAMSQFDETELADMSAEQVTRLMGMTEFPPEIAKRYENMQMQGRLELLNSIVEAPYMTDDMIIKTMNRIEPPKTTTKAADPERQMHMNKLHRVAEINNNSRPMRDYKMDDTEEESETSPDDESAEPKTTTRPFTGADQYKKDQQENTMKERAYHMSKLKEISERNRRGEGNDYDYEEIPPEKLSYDEIAQQIKEKFARQKFPRYGKQ